MLQFSDDPPCLNVGDEVSAKFKGAFCEAKIKDVKFHLRCKVKLTTIFYLKLLYQWYSFFVTVYAFFPTGG